MQSMYRLQLVLHPWTKAKESMEQAFIVPEIVIRSIGNDHGGALVFRPLVRLNAVAKSDANVGTAERPEASIDPLVKIFGFEAPVCAGCQQ